MASKRALIVDDSKTAQHRLKKLLRPYDLDIVTVDSAESALSYLSGSVPDVVFMDHLMPGMDGFRALQIIKSHPATATIPVIMYTSKSGDVYTSQARALGALDVVSKDTINASDLSHVLKAIHIYRDDQKASTQAATGAVEAEAAVEPPSSHPAADAYAVGSDKPPEAGNVLSLELRIRELEHTIDDNRRIITSRLVREMQGVRHLVNKLSTDVVALKHSTEDRNSKHTDDAEAQLLLEEPQPRGGYWRGAFAAAILVLGVMGWWQMDQRLAALDERQLEQSREMSSALTALKNNAAHQAGTEEPARPLASEPTGRQVSQQYLPDLSWALNQSSIQDFHRDLIAPETAQRLNELLARLSSRDFRGRVEVNVNAGDFCVVTDMGGQPQLPGSDSRMGSCALISEFYGMDASQAMAERLDAMLAESSLYLSEAIDVEILSLDRVFKDYPVLDASTSAQAWNEAARMNNRVMVNLEPGAPLTAHTE